MYERAMKQLLVQYCIIFHGGSLLGAAFGSASANQNDWPPADPSFLSHPRHVRRTTTTPLADAEYEHDHEQYRVPTFDLLELRHLSASDDHQESLRYVLRDTGLLSISVTNSPSAAAIRTIRQVARATICSCLRSDDNSAHARTVSGGILADGTRRTTLATATIGSSPIPLLWKEQEGIKGSGGGGSCSDEAASSLEALRDVVFGISQEFIAALDGLLDDDNHHQNRTLLKTARGRSYRTMQDIIRASHNLEHFHLYEKEQTDDCENDVNGDNDDGRRSETVLPIHTDAGLFLVFVPGMDCDNPHTPSNDSSLLVERRNGIVQRARFEPDTFGVLFGSGAEHWLLPNNPLQVRATRHAVRMRCGSRRAWYGMSTYT
jgi:hypothetical protein